MIAVGGQDLLLHIGKVKVVKTSAVEYRDGERTISPAGKLPLDHEVGG